MVTTKIIVIKSLEYSPTGILTKKNQQKLKAKIARSLKDVEGIVEVATPYESKMPAAYETGKIIAEEFGMHMWQELELNQTFTKNIRECMSINGDCQLLSLALDVFPEDLHDNVIQFSRLFKRLKFANKTFILVSEKPELSALLYYLLLADRHFKEAKALLNEPAFAPMESFTITLEDETVYLPERYPKYHLPFHDVILEELFNIIWENYIKKS